MFKGITFSEHFFEMIIPLLAAGGAATLPADRVNQSQMEEPLTASPEWSMPVSGPLVSAPTANIISTSGTGSGRVRCHRGGTEELCCHGREGSENVYAWLSVYTALSTCLSDPR